MKITVIGSGYVGLVAAACFADVGNDVLCLDINKSKITKLKKGVIPIYEPGLEKIVLKNIKNNNLNFTSNIKKSVHHGDIQFICVGTPQSEDGSADINYVIGAAENIAKFMTTSKIVVNKSTVPVGSAKRVAKKIKQILDERNQNFHFDVVSNPEFLREGNAINDFMHPDRVVIGSEDKYSIKIMKNLYKKFVKSSSALIVMDTLSSELTKYTANSLLACRISFMNEIANLAENLGANIEAVKKGIGTDSRIGESFLNAGCGYGGSCFPKDVAALEKIAKNNAGRNLKILRAAREVNDIQKNILFKKIYKKFKGNLANKKIAVWGLSFKPGTDDMREAPSIDLIKALHKEKVKIYAYDPIAVNESKKVLKEIPVRYKKNKIDCLNNADALVIVTEWSEFNDFNIDKSLALMKTPIILI
jgi:UDPglucose 6-dehydrogenase